MSKWIPYLMGEGGERLAPILLGEYPKDLKEVQQWFHDLPRTHPRLVGQHIEFEERPDDSVRVFVPGDIGGT